MPVTDHVIKACLDPTLSTDLLLDIADRAVAEHAGNAPPAAPGATRSRRERERLALLTRKAWSPGRTLHVSFLDGTPDVHARVQAVAEEWTRHANIRFEFGAGPDAEIRVAFRPGGSWSQLGTDAFTVAAGEPTMNLGWLTPATPDVEYSQVVLHEFGHALGCIHEHQSPAAGIPWDRDAVYAFYDAEFGWSRSDVDANVFGAYAVSQTQFSEFDEASIMLYPIAKELTTDGFEIGWNSTLSETDKNFIAARYPFEDTSIPRLESGKTLAGEIRGAGDVERFRFTVDLPGSYVLETSGSTDVVVELSGPNDPTMRIAEDDDGGLGRNARIEEFLMEGAYQVRIRHKRPTGSGRYTLLLIRSG